MNCDDLHGPLHNDNKPISAAVSVASRTGVIFLRFSGERGQAQSASHARQEGRPSRRHGHALPVNFN